MVHIKFVNILGIKVFILNNKIVFSTSKHQNQKLKNNFTDLGIISR